MATYLITGAGRGIGLELVNQALQRGETIVATVRERNKAQALFALEAAHVGRLEVFDLDVSDGQPITTLAKALAGRAIDRLINNAGLAYWRGFADSTEADMMEQFRVNAVGPVLMAQAFLPNLRLGKEKKIVNITSLMGSIADNGSGNAYGYRMSKAALNMATKGLSVDLRGDGIVVLALHPGWVKTAMGARERIYPSRKAYGGCTPFRIRPRPKCRAAFTGITATCCRTDPRNCRRYCKSPLRGGLPVMRYRAARF